MLQNCGQAANPFGDSREVFVRSRSVVSRNVAGEMLIVPVRGKVGDLASIYSFNGTGSLIWQTLDIPRALDELVDAVLREYEVDRESANKDVVQFLSDLLSVGLVETRDGVQVETRIGNVELPAAQIEAEI
jgi:hypothetical protein